jgi:DNA-binding IclR family transcriptional regulator
MTLHLERLISLLEVIAVAGRPLAVAEAQEATGLPRPTCYRLLQTLAEHRLIEAPNGDARYVIGERFVRIALLGKSDNDVRRATAHSLRKVAARLGEAVFLSRLRNNDVEIIHVETPDDPARSYIHPGLGKRPAHACSCAKVIAAFAEPDFQKALLAGSLKRYTEHTKTSVETIRAELAEIVRRGYAECDQEIDLGVASVAAPVQIGNIGVTFSIGAVGPIHRFAPEYRSQVGEQLKEFSKEVSGAIRLCNVPEN